MEILLYFPFSFLSIIILQCKDVNNVHRLNYYYRQTEAMKRFNELFAAEFSGCGRLRLIAVACGKNKKNKRREKNV